MSDEAETPVPLSAGQEETIAFNLCAVHGFDPDFVKTQRDFAIAVIREYEVSKPRLAPADVSTKPLETNTSAGRVKETAKNGHVTAPRDGFQVTLSTGRAVVHEGKTAAVWTEMSADPTAPVEAGGSSRISHRQAARYAEVGTDPMTSILRDIDDRLNRDAPDIPGARVAIHGARLAAAYSALRPQLMAQDEMMVVPVEPTDAMVEAAYEHWLNKTGDAGRYVVRNIIKAALSAAPAKPAAVEGAGERDKRAWIDRWCAIEDAAKSALHTMNELLDAPNLKRMQYALGERRDALQKALDLPEAGTAWMRPAHPSPPADDALRVAVEAWDELAKRPSWEISFSGFDEEDGWSVHSVTGGVNDREWDELARADTPLEAVLAALKSTAAKEGVRSERA